MSVRLDSALYRLAGATPPRLCAPPRLSAPPRAPAPAGPERRPGDSGAWGSGLPLGGLFWGRLQLSPVASCPERVTVTNWDVGERVIAIGDVRIELDPGQSIVVLIDNLAPIVFDDCGAPCDFGPECALAEEHALLM